MSLPRPFLIELYPKAIDSGEYERRFPPHRLILEPLVRAALEVWVHCMPGGADAPPLPPASRRAKGTFGLDLAQEVIRGWEWFWNASCWQRGAVSITVDAGRVDWSEVFSWTQYGGGVTTTYQLRKSSPMSALKHADRAARGDAVVVMLTASNGLQWAEVWTDECKCVAFDALAQATCRRFVRWVEQGKYEREIIYDRPPYTDFAKD